MRITQHMINLLELLASEKKAGNQFIYINAQRYRKPMRDRLINAGLIFESPSPIDRTRFAITSAGVKALQDAKAPRFNYFWEGRGYLTIIAMAKGENMSYDQARWRAKNGYTSNKQLKHGGAVVIAGIEYENAEVARITLGYVDKRTISKIMARQRNGTFKRLNLGQKKRQPSTRKYLLQRAYERIMGVKP